MADEEGIDNNLNTTTSCAWPWPGSAGGHSTTQQEPHKNKALHEWNSGYLWLGRGWLESQKC